MIDSHVRRKRPKVILLLWKNHLKQTLFVHSFIQLNLFSEHSQCKSDRYNIHYLWTLKIQDSTRYQFEKININNYS